MGASGNLNGVAFELELKGSLSIPHVKSPIYTEKGKHADNPQHNIQSDAVLHSWARIV